MQKYWDKVPYEIRSEVSQPHEAHLLKLDCSKAHKKLGWKDVWKAPEIFQHTAQWYHQFYESQKVISQTQIEQYVEDATHKNLIWTQL
jgi:CDP-glucose 4,6-dehydratase